MVFNTTFNNISFISWRSVLFVEETGVPRENHWPAASHWQTLSHNVVASKPHLGRFKLKTLVMMHTDCIDIIHPTTIQSRLPPYLIIYMFSLRKKEKIGLHIFLCGGCDILVLIFFYFELLSLNYFCSLLYFYIKLTRMFWGYSFLRIGMCAVADLLWN